MCNLVEVGIFEGKGKEGRVGNLVEGNLPFVDVVVAVGLEVGDPMGGRVLVLLVVVELVHLAPLGRQDLFVLVKGCWD